MSFTGTAVSGAFLFIIGLANSIILIKILRKRRKVKSKHPVEPIANSNTSDHDLDI